jgi:hypothetical protein
MKIPNELATHEAGHLVIGLRIGIDEQGIGFRPPRPRQVAASWCKHLDRDPQKAIIRSFSGLLAHIRLLPDSIAPDLGRAYAHSIIIDPEHPNFHELAQSDREFLSGAKDDMGMSWTYALDLKPASNSRRATSQRPFLSNAYCRARMPVALAANTASLAPSLVCQRPHPALGRLHSRAHRTSSLCQTRSWQSKPSWLANTFRARVPGMTTRRKRLDGTLTLRVCLTQSQRTTQRSRRCSTKLLFTNWSGRNSVRNVK